MTIDEAIKILEHIHSLMKEEYEVTDRRAIKLGTEALKEIKNLKSPITGVRLCILSDETKD